MAKLEPVAIQIIGVEDMRRLSAALEQYNAGSRGDAAQINRLESHLTEARDELAIAGNIIRNRQMILPGQPPHRTRLLNDIAELVDRDVRREIGADHAETKQQLAVALDRIHQLEQVHDQQVAALKKARADVDDQRNEVNGERARRVELENKIARLGADLRKEQKIKAFVNDEFQKIRAALGLAPLAQAPEVLAAIEDLRNGARLSESRAEVIKHLHEEYHQLQVRKQGAEFDLERAKEEIAFAEAETAKHKPLIEAVRETGARGGALFIAAGHWVELNGWATTAATDGKQYTRVELSGNYLSGDLKCL